MNLDFCVSERVLGGFGVSGFSFSFLFRFGEGFLFVLVRRWWLLFGFFYFGKE